MGEYLTRLSAADVEALRAIASRLARDVAPQVASHHHEQRGYVPVFMDGTAIEVGGLNVSGRLHPSGSGVTHGWRGQ